MFNFSRVIKRLDYVFIILVLLLVGFNAVYLSNSFFPRHDTLLIFEHFYHFYNHFYFNNTPPLWLSFYSFGKDAIYDSLLLSITPIGAFSIVLGRIMGVTNVLGLYKFSILAEQCVFLTGMYLFSKSLFTSKRTVFFVCLTAIGSIVWQLQLYLNFRLYAYLPLILYLLLRFYREEKAYWLWIVGLVGIAWTNGTNYLVMLWIPLLALILVTLLIQKPALLKRIFQKSRKSIVLFASLLLVVAIQVYTLKTASDELSITSSREENNTVDLSTFLHYGGNTQVDEVFISLVLGYPIFLPSVGTGYDTSIYFGLLPFILFFVTLFAGPYSPEQKPFYQALLVGLFFLSTLALNGLLAGLYYFSLPTMRFFRHISLIMGLVRLFMILLAGFSFEWITSTAFQRTDIKTIFISALVVLFFAEIFGATKQLMYDFKPLLLVTRDTLKDIFSMDVSASWTFFFQIRMLGNIFIFPILILLFRPKNRSQTSTTMTFAILGAVLIDLAIFQTMVYVRSPKLPEDYLADLSATHVHKVEYQPERYQQPVTPHQQQAHNLAYAPGKSVLYAAANIFIQFDACMPLNRSVTWSADVSEYFSAKEQLSIPETQNLNLLHCEIPKLHLVTEETIVNTQQQAFQLIKEGYDVRQGVIIVGDVEPANNREGTADPAGEVEVIEFNEDTLKANVQVNNGGAWLVYADSYSPWWKATIDGSESRVYKAYGVFKTIWVEAGEHTIEFRYHPPYRLTYILTFIYDTLFGLGLMVISARLIVKTEDND